MGRSPIALLKARSAQPCSAMPREGTVSAQSGAAGIKGEWGRSLSPAYFIYRTAKGWVFLPAAALRWWRLSQLAPSTPARSHLSREAFGQVIWWRFSLFQLVGGERCWFFSHIMSCFVHVSTGSVLCLRSRLHGEFRNATSRFWFRLSSVFNPCTQTMHSNRNRFLNGGSGGRESRFFF